MNAPRLIVVGLLLSVAGGVGREVPHIIKGLSVWSVLQVLGLLCIAAGLLWRPRTLGERFRKSKTARYGLLLVVTVLLMLGALAFRGIRTELEEGRFWRRVAVVLDRDEPQLAWNLAVMLGWEVRRDRSPLLRLAIVRRIGELGNEDPEVTGALRERMRADKEDPEVRRAAAESLARLLNPWEIVRLVTELPRLDAESRRLYLLALRTGTGREDDDPASWRDWLAEGLAGAEGEKAFRIALELCRSFPDAERLRAACLGRIATGEGVPFRDLRYLVDDEDPEIRSAVAAALGLAGEQGVSPLARALLAERDEDAAAAMTEALVVAHPTGAPLGALYDAAARATGEAARAVARRRLIGLLGLEDRAGDGDVEEDRVEAGELAVAVRRRLPPGIDRWALLRDLVRLAPESAAARAELLRIARDDGEMGKARVDALEGLAPGDLVTLLEEAPSPGFAEAVRRALRERTGKDGGLDPGKWRELLGN